MIFGFRVELKIGLPDMLRVILLTHNILIGLLTYISYATPRTCFECREACKYEDASI